jgi:hypothetical protein
VAARTPGGRRFFVFPPASPIPFFTSKMSGPRRSSVSHRADPDVPSQIGKRTHEHVAHEQQSRGPNYISQYFHRSQFTGTGAVFPSEQVIAQGLVELPRDRCLVSRGWGPACNTLGRMADSSVRFRSYRTRISDARWRRLTWFFPAQCAACDTAASSKASIQNRWTS